MGIDFLCARITVHVVVDATREEGKR